MVIVIVYEQLPIVSNPYQLAVARKQYAMNNEIWSGHKNKHAGGWRETRNNVTMGLMKFPRADYYSLRGKEQTLKSAKHDLASIAARY